MSHQCFKCLCLSSLVMLIISVVRSGCGGRLPSQFLKEDPFKTFLGPTIPSPNVDIAFPLYSTAKSWLTASDFFAVERAE